jgi:anaerobic ribonucleoside-triphosphate reductase
LFEIVNWNYTNESYKQVIKRDGRSVDFNPDKIRMAIIKAFNEVDHTETPSTRAAKTAFNISKKISKKANKRSYSVEEIQDMVIYALMATTRKDVALAYSNYRLGRKVIREVHGNTTDKSIMEIVEGKSDYWNGENSNKNPRLNSTIRDYIAGETSKDISRRILLPHDIMEGHDEGILHFHDSDYYIQKIANCSLINLEDMLQNGTVISEVMIEKPHSFSTACNIATQIIAQVASSQYGGQSISLAHLAPFVDVSRQSIRKDVISERERNGDDLDESKIEATVQSRLQKEVRKGIQCIQYQVTTLMTTNGQAPFLTVFMYLGEAKNEQEKEDLAMLIREVLEQRYQGVKNDQGIFVSPSFPKLIYVTEPDNIYAGSKYFDLTLLALKCSAKRITPDYISEKKMKENKEGNCFPVMGCVTGTSAITYKYRGVMYIENMEEMWDRLSRDFGKIEQVPDSGNYYIDIDHTQIYDSVKGFVNVSRMVCNRMESPNTWYNIRLKNGKMITCTHDHPLPVTGKGRTYAENLELGDKIPTANIQPVEVTESVSEEDAYQWGYYIAENACKLEYDISHMNQVFDFYEKYMRNDIRKNVYHIPSIIFKTDVNTRLAFLAGMIDAFGTIEIDEENNVKFSIDVYNHTTSDELMMLLTSVGIPSGLSDDKNKYRIDGTPKYYSINAEVTKELYEKLVVSNTLGGEYNFYKANASELTTDSEIISIKTSTVGGYWSYDVTTESDHFDVSGIYSHNCRSALAPWKDENGNYKFYGRFNQGVVTINLPDIALSSGGDFKKFWEIFDERTELCHKALQYRHKRLKGTSVDVAPIMWKYGALARLKDGDTIDSLLYGGYSSISLGYAGLYECVKYMTGHSHADEGPGTEFGLEVMKALNAKCNQWKEAENIGYSLYGTPIESTTEKFALALRRRFGVIPGITDKDYITNSYHVPVFEEVDAFTKLKIESIFQDLSTGGAVSYIETPDMQNNIDSMLEVLQYMYENIMYAEFNTKSDYCKCCGYDGEIQLVTDPDTGKYIWKCPKCGNTDPKQMNVTRRTCGEALYL